MTSKKKGLGVSVRKFRNLSCEASFDSSDPEHPMIEIRVWDKLKNEPCVTSFGFNTRTSTWKSFASWLSDRELKTAWSQLASRKTYTADERNLLKRFQHGVMWSRKLNVAMPHGIAILGMPTAEPEPA